jgi:WD40 repeat protein
MMRLFHGCLVAVFFAAPAGGAAPPITAAAFTPDGKQVVLGSQAGIELRSWPELKPVSALKTSLRHVHDLAFAPDGKTLLAAGGAPAEEGAVEVIAWPPKDKDKSRRIAIGDDLVYRVAWAPDGSRWAAASADAVCRVFAKDGDKPAATYEGHSRAVLAIVFLPDGKTVVSAGVDQSLQVWEADSGKALRTLDNHVAAVNDLALRPKTGEAPPTIASVSDDRTVRLWQPTTGRLMRFARLDSAPRAVAWSPDGTRLFAGGSDGKAGVLDPDTLEGATSGGELGGRLHTLLVSPDGKHLLLGGAAGSVRAAALKPR